MHHKPLQSESSPAWLKRTQTSRQHRCRGMQTNSTCKPQPAPVADACAACVCSTCRPDEAALSSQLLMCEPISQASLERIARSRTSGILRSELPKQLGVKQSNFHYVMKQLLSRSLVKATPIKFTRNRTCISTAALHLTRFAPEISLASCQVCLSHPAALCTSRPWSTCLDLVLLSMLGYYHTRTHVMSSCSNLVECSASCSRASVASP